MNKSRRAADTFHALFERIVESAVKDSAQPEHHGQYDRLPARASKRPMIGRATTLRRSTLAAVRWLQQEDQGQM